MLYIVYIIIIVFLVVVVMFQNGQVIVTSLGYCLYIGGSTQSPNCWSSCNVGLDGNDSDIVIEDICERMAC